MVRIKYITLYNSFTLQRIMPDTDLDILTQNHLKIISRIATRKSCREEGASYYA